MSSKSKEQAAKRKPDPSETLDRSCRAPILFLVCSALLWLVVGSFFSLLAGVKMHAPGMMADAAWSTYGRVHPTGSVALLYGFLTQAGMAVAIWSICRMGRTVLVDGGYVFLGGVLWNVGVTFSVLGILGGNASGLEGLPMPGKVVPLLFFGYAVIGLSAVQTINRRTEEFIHPAMTFFLGALFWFPWVLGAAYLLLEHLGVHGVMINVVDWWYAQNFIHVILAFLGLGGLFFLLPRLTGRELPGRGSALFAFWMLLIFNSLGGVPSGSPVPAWLPSIGAVSAVFSLFGVVAAWVLMWRLFGAEAADERDTTSVLLLKLAAIFFLAGGLLRVWMAFPGPWSVVRFTSYVPAMELFHAYGFTGLVVLAGLFHMTPRLTGVDWAEGGPWVLGIPILGSVRLTALLIVVGLLSYVVPMALEGWIGGDNQIGYGVYFASFGDILLLAGHLGLLLNFFWLMIKGCKQCCWPFVVSGSGAEAKA